MIANHNQHGLLHSARDSLGNLGMVVAHRSHHRGADGGLYRRSAADALETQRSGAPHAELAPPSDC